MLNKLRNKKKTKNPIVDKVCLGAVLGIFGTVALINLIQPNRPTVSEAEKRTLAKMPEFSFEALTDGSYFSDISLFISDTFIARDSLVTASKKLETLRGANYSLGGDADFALIHTNGGQTADEGADDEMASKLAEALDTLNKQTPADETEDGEQQGTEPSDITEPDDEPEEPDENDGEPIGDEPIIGERETLLANGDIRELLSGNGGDGSGVKSVKVSKNELKLTVGSGSTVKATVDTRERGSSVVWSVSDSGIAEIAVNREGGVDVKAVGAGSCYLICKSGTEEAKCEIKVTEISAVSSNQNADNADFLADGLFIYGDAVYTQGAYSYANAKNYLDTALYYKNLFGANTAVNVVVAPVSSMVIDNPQITSQIPDQRVIMDNMASICDPSVNFVDTYAEMYAHRNDYLFFKTDHHWTARGAYYAYVAFAKSKGFTPTPLEDFDYVLKNEYYQGSMYMYTQDARVQNFYDEVEAFISRKPHTMTITTRQGTTENYNSSVVSFNDTYVSFIAGDNPYTVINVPGNPQNMNVLVLKDSFGNAFVPFLCEHYGNIIVVDTRYSSFNIYDQLADYGITDIIFVNNIQAANSPAWSRLYLAAVGVE